MKVARSVWNGGKAVKPYLSLRAAQSGQMEIPEGNSPIGDAPVFVESGRRNRRMQSNGGTWKWRDFAESREPQRGAAAGAAEAARLSLLLGAAQLGQMEIPEGNSQIGESLALRGRTGKNRPHRAIGGVWKWWDFLKSR